MSGGSSHWVHTPNAGYVINEGLEIFKQ